MKNVSSDVFVHERALCESKDVGARTRVWAFAHVMAGARIGADCNVCAHAFVEDGVVVGDRVTIKNGVALWNGLRIGDDVFLGPYAVFTNDPRPRATVKKGPAELLPTVIERESTIGANATVFCGITIGRGAFIGAGAVVLRDVAPFALVVGNPARRIGWACSCGERLNEDLTCACGRCYRQSDASAGLEPMAQEGET